MVSYRCVVDTPQDVQRNLWAPTCVLSLCLVLLSHAGYFAVLMAIVRREAKKRGFAVTVCRFTGVADTLLGMYFSAFTRSLLGLGSGLGRCELLVGSAKCSDFAGWFWQVVSSDSHSCAICDE